MEVLQRVGHQQLDRALAEHAAPRVRVAEAVAFGVHFENASRVKVERNMQRMIDNGSLNPRKRDAWIALGITLCVILTNEIDGVEWMTLIDGSREVPVLVNMADDKTIDPMKLVWSKVKNGESVNLTNTYEQIL